jgi:signal transduction histidine kinase
MSGLQALVDEIAAAGLAVRIEIVGPAVPLPSEVDRSAYRIVQEALTNVRRHAGPGACTTVRVEYRPDELELRVIDDGTAAASTLGSAAAGGGIAADGGIAGMRERVAALGGEFEAGPRDSGGFQVRARLPVPAENGQR